MTSPDPPRQAGPVAGLRLSTYFGERDRVGGELVADRLLRLYGEHGVRGSILLRGVSGFGLGQRLRTDRLLTLSEDLPAVSIAFDTVERIGALLDSAAELQQRGLVTLERISILAGAAEAKAGLREAAKLTIFLGRRQRVGARPAFVAACDLLHRHGLAGATALLGVDGTLRGRRQRARWLSRNVDVPVMLIAVGSGERIWAILPELQETLGDPLVTLERVRICKRDGTLLRRPHELPASDAAGNGLWQKLTLYTSETARHEGLPIHAELTRRLRSAGAAGATTVRGIWGFHGEHAPHGESPLGLRHRVPAVTTVVERPQHVATAFAIADELTAERGLVTTEMVPAMTASSGRIRRGGLRLASHAY